MASPSLHGVPRDGSPASTILWDAPTPRRPSRPVRILHEPIPSCRPWFAPLGRGRPTGGQGVVGSGLPIRIDDGNVGVSQVPWKPWWSLSVLFDPGRIRQAEWTKSKLPDTAPAWVHDERSRRLVLSGLNHTTFDLTVYASQGWSPTRHARLASGCWSSSTGRDWLPAGFHLKGFKLPTILLSRASWHEVRPGFRFQGPARGSGSDPREAQPPIRPLNESSQVETCSSPVAGRVREGSRFPLRWVITIAGPTGHSRGNFFSGSLSGAGKGFAGSGPVLQPIMPLDSPVKVRPWKLTVIHVVIFDAGSG